MKQVTKVGESARNEALAALDADEKRTGNIGLVTKDVAHLVILRMEEKLYSSYVLLLTVGIGIGTILTSLFFGLFS